MFFIASDLMVISHRPAFIGPADQACADKKNIGNNIMVTVFLTIFAPRSCVKMLLSIGRPGNSSEPLECRDLTNLAQACQTP